MYGITNYRSTGLSQVATGIFGSLVLGTFLLTVLAGPTPRQLATPSPVAQVTA